MQNWSIALATAFILTGFLTCGAVHGQTCASEIQRCKSIVQSINGSKSIDSVCSPSGSFTTCVNMLGQYCTGAERNDASALTTYITYFCSDQGKTDALEFVICNVAGTCSQAYANDIQTMGLCSAGGVYKQCIKSGCNSQAERLVTHILSLVETTANCGN